MGAETQDQPPDWQSAVYMDKMRALVKKFYEFQERDSGALNQAWGPWGLQRWHAREAGHFAVTSAFPTHLPSHHFLYLHRRFRQNQPSSALSDPPK